MLKLFKTFVNSSPSTLFYYVENKWAGIIRKSDFTEVTAVTKFTGNKI